MSKILLLSAGTRVESKNNKISKITENFLINQLKIECSLYDNFYENVPFLKDYNDEHPDYVINVRDDLINSSKILIFSPVFNGGYVSHLKNILDWLSLSFDKYSYNELFKNKKVAVVSSVDGKGNNAKNSFILLKEQLKNYGLNVFDEFYLFNEENKVDDFSSNKELNLSYFNFINSFIMS
ncbi:MAG: NADPH-dependent FMN reductase [Candidatus Actinomarina sp.]|tara:strand:- start:1552 stop:2094 length:543 start_codon:yes stop_codon:yes gene_type:complete